MLGTTLALAALLAIPPPEHQKSIRFIGNSGFEITDGSSAVLIDFPYRSGAFGYMTFEPSEIHERSNSLCIFTHRHADHFDPKDLPRIGCAVTGPSEVLAKIGSIPQLEGESPWEFGGASILCIPSEHGDVEHCSYLLTWHGSTVLVSGDVESISSVLEKVADLDLLLLPYWLAGEAPEIRQRYPDAKIVLSHQEPSKSTELCSGCERLAQGESIEW